MKVTYNRVKEDCICCICQKLIICGNKIKKIVVKGKQYIYCDNHKDHHIKQQTRYMIEENN